MDNLAQKPTPQQQANLIRPEQVNKLPQLNPQQKQQFFQGVTRYWEILNTTQPTDPQYQEALNRLHSTSQQLMAGMKQWQVRKQMQQAAQQQAATQNQAQTQVQAQVQAQAQAQAPKPAGQAVQGLTNAASGQTGGSAVQFSQLLPEIQRKVNEHHFYYPPAMNKGTEPAEVWLREAKARLGQAMQRLQVAKQKKAEFHRTAQQRQAAGNPLTPEETAVYNNKIAQCDRAVTESTSFMKKFNEQQEQFRNAQPQHQFSKQGATGAEGTDTTAAPHMPPGVQGPTAHSISSAVSAARNQASAAQASSPTALAPTASQSAGAVTQQTPSSATQTQFPQPPGDTSAAPRPVSHHGQAMPPLQHAPSSGVHPHPLNTSINGVKTATPHITKNLQLPDPKPVQMPPSRPTLTGGAGVGLPGQLAQPAITALPGYVLESSEDGRVLSKKKLNELVREVCGPGPEEQLDPEAEEIFLAIADDFVDELVSQSCKLAKLRGSASLELRDIQIVLERQYNIRVPGISTDEIRTVRRPQPAPGWAHKMGAVQAAKLTGGGSAAATTGTNAKEA
ncbi:transcription initiation factor TFIID subunit 12 [Cladophialophora carrionii]|uniref:Transcription initiation factor TFIID subunit 12 n=1 Tax=Cladophialophora carrionii TaxID=86049 RepID=A0A1C1CR39_9EURO|nr:transcription initiation factor TFIID subunit 12 [Cladophialophora carrionii]